MKDQKKEWHYVNVEAGQLVGPVTFAELDKAFKAGEFEEYSEVFTTQMLRQSGVYRLWLFHLD